MTLLRTVLTTAAIGGALLSTGCEMVDSQMVAQMREYFPLAEIAHPQPDVLVIHTHLANLTEKFAEETVATMLRQHCCHGGGPLTGAMVNQDLDAILPLAGYSTLDVAFENVICGWRPTDQTTLWCRPTPGPNLWHRYSINTQASFPVIQAPQQPFRAPALQPLQPIQQKRKP